MRSLVGFPLDSLNLYHQTEVPMQNLKKEDIKQEVFDLYDDYVHSRVTRRDFVQRLSAYAVGGLTVTALMSFLMPDYKGAVQIASDDPRLASRYVKDRKSTRLNSSH